MWTWELESMDIEMQNRMSLLSNREWSNLVKELTPYISEQANPTDACCQQAVPS
jgi:hypothetical protein